MTVKYVDAILEQVDITNDTIYTAPTATNFESAHIIFGNCTNEGTVDTELTVNVVQNGESVGVANRYLPPRVIFAGQYDPLTPLVGRVLKGGDYISVIGSLVDNLNLSIGIKEIYTDS